MDFLQKFLDGENIRPAEVETFITKILLIDYRNRGVDQIIDIDGLDSGAAIAEHRDQGQPSQTSQRLPTRRIFTQYNRWPLDSIVQSALGDDLLAFEFRLRVIIM